jgi:hypothetical protein
MTGRDEPGEDQTPEDSEPGRPDPMTALLKRSLQTPATTRRPSILRDVQRRIRKRSRGKFFADGWSTTNGRVSYMIIALAMLVVLAIAYVGLGPVSIQ